MTTHSEVQAVPQDIHTYLTKLVKEAIARYLAREGLTKEPEQLPIDLRFSAQSSFGDYSMPVMQWSGKNKLVRPTMGLAEALGDLLREVHSPSIDEISITKPGFLNFRLNRPA